MYRCDNCNRVTYKREKSNLVVTQVKSIIHRSGDRGFQIVKEIKVCDPCLPKVNKEPEVV